MCVRFSANYKQDLRRVRIRNDHLWSSVGQNYSEWESILSCVMWKNTGRQRKDSRWYLLVWFDLNACFYQIQSKVLINILKCGHGILIFPINRAISRLKSYSCRLRLFSESRGFLPLLVKGRSMKAGLGTSVISWIFADFSVSSWIFSSFLSYCWILQVLVISWKTHHFSADIENFDKSSTLNQLDLLFSL